MREGWYAEAEFGHTVLDVSPDVTVRAGGEEFRCDCDCNVFRWIKDVQYGRVLRCNACGALYEGN